MQSSHFGSRQANFVAEQGPEPDAGREGVELKEFALLVVFQFYAVEMDVLIDEVDADAVDMHVCVEFFAQQTGDGFQHFVLKGRGVQHNCCNKEEQQHRENDSADYFQDSEVCFFSVQRAWLIESI